MGVVALPATNAFAQEKQRVVIKALAENTKFLQRQAIDVGDFPGHQVRIFEIRRTYPNNAPIINGLKLVEQLNRGMVDDTNGNGLNYNYRAPRKIATAANLCESDL
jgi:hypothetical protein